jgi:hypothetical protein
VARSTPVSLARCVTLPATSLKPDPIGVAWLMAGIAHGWTAEPLPTDPYANAWAIGRGVEIFERNEDNGVIRPASPESLKVAEQEQAEGVIPCYKSDDPKSPYKGAPLELLELERRSPGGSDRDERPVLTQAASQNLRKRNADSSKLPTAHLYLPGIHTSQLSTTSETRKRASLDVLPSHP